MVWKTIQQSIVGVKSGKSNGREMWILGTIPCRIFNDLHEVVSNPRSGYNGQTEWIRLDVAWMAYLVLITRK